MATTVSITRSHLFSPGGDVDLDNMADPGNSIITIIRIQNLTAFDALNVTVTDTLIGSPSSPAPSRSPRSPSTTLIRRHRQHADHVTAWARAFSPTTSTPTAPEAMPG